MKNCFDILVWFWFGLFCFGLDLFVVFSVFTWVLIGFLLSLCLLFLPYLW